MVVESAQILYVVDPMCSWCWGFRRVLDEVIPQCAEGVGLQLVMGGLAPDSDAPMDDDTRGYVQDNWRAVAERTGAIFNHDFWSKCHPRRSTYPACRAVMIADQEGLGRAMLAAIQRAYYLEARNPSDIATLAELADALGIDPDKFTRTLASAATQERLEGDFHLRRQLGASSFPSLGIEVAGERRLLTSGWIDTEPLLGLLGAEGLLA